MELLLGGVDRPTSGKVYINGTDIFAMNDDELAKSLEKAKLMLSEDDFSKLVEFINMEKRRQNN